MSAARPVDGDSATAQAAATALPAMIVHKTEGCGCCEAWIAQVRLAGYRVEVRDEEDLGGHVPVADIRKLLQERPDARSDGSGQAFVVELVARDGSTRPYSEYAAKSAVDAASQIA